MREWAAIQQLFSLGRTCLNYPNEAEWLWLRRKALGGMGPCKAIQERPGDQGAQCVCIYVCVTRRMCSTVKLNGACRVPNEPLLAGRLTHNDLPLCTSLSHPGCQGIVVNPSLAWTLAFAKPIHIFNKDLTWRMHMSQYGGLPFFLSCLVKN